MLGVNDRFKDAAWFPRDRAIQVQIGGAGGIGRYICISHL